MYQGTDNRQVLEIQDMVTEVPDIHGPVRGGSGDSDSGSKEVLEIQELLTK